MWVHVVGQRQNAEGSRERAGGSFPDRTASSRATQAPDGSPAKAADLGDEEADTSDSKGFSTPAEDESTGMQQAQGSRMVSWASVRTHAGAPLSEQYDWRDVPERLEVTSPAVPASVFALMMGPDEDTGESSGPHGPSFKANGAAVPPPARSLPTSPEGSSSSITSQPPAAAAAPRTLSSGQASNPSLPAHVPPDIHPASVVGPSGDQAPAEASQATVPAAVPPAPTQARAPPVQRRYTGWGDPNAPPPIAWPPAADRTPSQPSRSGTSEEASNGKIKARTSTDNEGVDEAKQKPGEGPTVALKSHATKWNVLEKLAAWRSKYYQYYDAQERWILVLPLLLFFLLHNMLIPSSLFSSTALWPPPLSRFFLHNVLLLSFPLPFFHSMLEPPSP